MPPRRAPQAAPPPAANPVDLASKCDAKDFLSCLFCEEEIDRDGGEYVVNECSICGNYPVHKECLEEYLETGKGDYKVSTNTQKKGMREAMIRRHPASQAKGRRCGKGRYGASIDNPAFPHCQGTILDTQLYDSKHKHKEAARAPANLANQLRQQNRQQAQQAKQAAQQPDKQKPAAKGKAGVGAKGTAAPTIQVLNKVGVQPKGRDKDGGESLVSSAAGQGLGTLYGGEIIEHDLKMTGIEAELAVYHGLMPKSFKAKLCPLEQYRGACPHGDLCNDAHTVEELRIDEAIKLGHVDKLYKCNICQAYARNQACVNGLYCPDAHSLKERRTAVAIQHKLETQDYRTTYCSYAGTGTTCPKGLLCRDAHSVEEHRRDAAWQVGGVTQADDGKYKTKLCAQFFKEGSCKYGFRCDFAHTPRDLRVTAALEANQLHQGSFKTKPCPAGMACPGAAHCWSYHNEEDHMSPFFISKRRLCPTMLELSNCFLSDRPGYVCPFAHDVVELEIIDYIKRKLKRRHVAAGGGSPEPKPAPADAVLLPRSVLEGKLPAKEPQGVNKNAAKRQNRRNKKAVALGLGVLGPVMEEEEFADGGGGAAPATPAANGAWNGGVEDFPQLGVPYIDPAAATEEADLVIPYEVLNLMRQYKLASCVQKLAEIGFDNHKAVVISKYAAADVEFATDILMNMGDGIDLSQYDQESPVNVDSELEELQLMASEWGLGHQDVVDVLRMSNGSFEEARVSLEVRKWALPRADGMEGHYATAPVASNAPTQPPPAVPRAPAPRPVAPAAVAQPSARDQERDRDKGFAPDSGKFIAPLPFPTQPPAQPPPPAAVQTEPVTLVPPTKSPAAIPTPPAPVAPPPATLTQTTAAGAYAPAPAEDDVSRAVVPPPASESPPAVETYTDGTEAMADPAAAWPEAYYEEQAEYGAEQPVQCPVNQRDWWPEEAFLGFNPNASAVPVPAPRKPALVPPPGPPRPSYGPRPVARPATAFPHPLDPAGRGVRAPAPSAAQYPAAVRPQYIAPPPLSTAPAYAAQPAPAYAPPPAPLYAPRPAPAFAAQPVISYAPHRAPVYATQRAPAYAAQPPAVHLAQPAAAYAAQPAPLYAARPAAPYRAHNAAAVRPAAAAPQVLDDEKAQLDALMADLL